MLTAYPLTMEASKQLNSCIFDINKLFLKSTNYWLNYWHIMISTTEYCIHKTCPEIEYTLSMDVKHWNTFV